LINCAPRNIRSRLSSLFATGSARARPYIRQVFWSDRVPVGNYSSRIASPSLPSTFTIDNRSASQPDLYLRRAAAQRRTTRTRPHPAWPCGSLLTKADGRRMTGDGGSGPGSARPCGLSGDSGEKFMVGTTHQRRQIFFGKKFSPSILFYICLCMLHRRVIWLFYICSEEVI
jgi:hypothetical protein